MENEIDQNNNEINELTEFQARITDGSLEPEILSLRAKHEDFKAKQADDIDKILQRHESSVTKTALRAEHIIHTVESIASQVNLFIF